MFEALHEAFTGPVLLPALIGASVLVFVKLASIWADRHKED